MDRKELNAINRLFDCLDKDLTWNAALLGRRSGDPDMESVDELGKLFERHRYLKNDHNFAPGEAEALLCFQSPLVVAQSCWEENGFTNYPICEILDSIGAFERFTLTREEQGRRNVSQVQRLIERLDQNLAAYTAALMEKNKSELIEGSEEITKTQAAYSYMKDDFDYSYGDAALLLKLDDPLHYLASRWSMAFDLSGDDDDTIQEIIEELEDPRNLRHAQETAAALVQTAQEADQCPIDWRPAVDQETKKLLMERLDQNYAAYTASLADVGKQELIERSVEIASVQDAYGAPYRSTSNGPYGAAPSNCAGWATLCSDAAFGNLPWRRVDRPSWEQIRAGDLIEYTNGSAHHVVVVLRKTDEYVSTTESGTNNRARWGGQYPNRVKKAAHGEGLAGRVRRFAGREKVRLCRVPQGKGRDEGAVDGQGQRGPLNGLRQI